MPDEVNSADNVERLLAHLEDETFAVQLVSAYRDAQGGDTAGALKAVLTEHLEGARAKFDDTD